MMRTGTARRGASSWRAGIDSSRDRLVLLEMALVWSRLAEYAAETAARKDCAELEATQHCAALSPSI